MTRIAAVLRLAVILMAGVSVASCGGQSEWRELDSGEGGFAVLMRGAPRYVKQDLNTPAGPMSAYLYSSDRPDAYYAVGYSDYPLSLVLGADPQGLFSGVRDTWVRRINGRLVASDDTLKLDGRYPGIEFTAFGTEPTRGGKSEDSKSKPADTFVQARLFLVDQRLYQIVALGHRNEVPQGEVNRFLQSFRLSTSAPSNTIKIGPKAEPKGK